MNYKNILKLRWPNKVPVQILNETYEGIVWNELDLTPNPTKEELDAAINEIVGSSGSVTSIVDGTPIGVSNIPTYLGKINSFSVPSRSGTTLIPFDNTIPSSTEGTLIGSVSIVPVSINSKFLLNGSFFVDSSTGNRNISISIFRNGVCVHVKSANVNTAGRPVTLSFNFVDIPLIDTQVTYNFRVGVSSSATWYLNQSSGGVNFSNLSASSITAMEFLQ